jgi:hypothetical protein
MVMPSDSGWNWGRVASAEDLRALAHAQQSFRTQWASTEPHFPGPFDGNLADVDALDYLHYEGYEYPECGIEGAGLVCGEVLRKAARLHWVISQRGEWFIADADVPRIVINPVARLQEVIWGWGGASQFNKHLYFLQRAAFDCLTRASGEAASALRHILTIDAEHICVGEVRDALRLAGERSA